MTKSKFESLIEHILNDDEDKARELFHDIVVEKSREIYDTLVSEDEEVEENFVSEIGDESDDMQSDIEADHAGMGADDSEMDDDDSMDDDNSDMGDQEAGEEEIEDRVVDLEAALDDLKAEFDRLMSDEANEPEHADMDNNMDGMDNEMPKEGMVREYVEKVAAPAKSETNANTKSIVAGKNDMGGTTSNIAKGGANANPTSPSKPSNQYAKGQGNLPGAGSFENVPGASAGKAYSSAKKPVTSEVGGTNTASPLAK